MAEAVVSIVVEMLGDFLIQEANFLGSVREKVEQMQTELKLMRAFLENADKRQDEDKIVQVCISEIREAAYGQIKGSSSGNRMQHPQWRQTYGHVEEDTVGLDKDIKILVAQLVNENENTGFVSICGMGGLGKTTLAKKVFNHSDIRRFFYGFAWAYISQQFQPRDVWEGILFKIDSESDQNRERIKKLKHDEVAEKLQQVLEQKKCLVILDDSSCVERFKSCIPRSKGEEQSIIHNP